MQIIERPQLRRPVLLMAFTGWVDGGQVSTTALRFLIDQWKARKFAELDPEEYYNFTRVRPQVALEPDFSRVITWPETALYYHVDPTLDRDFVLLLGIEPNFKWRTFCEEMLAICQDIGIVSAISLGGVIADVPHTRAARITVFTADPELRARFPELRQRRGGYQGPTGIIGVLGEGLTRVGIPVGNMRGAVPHYIAGSPNPKVSLALLARLAQLYDLHIDLSEMERAARRFDRQVNRTLAERSDMADYIRTLEARVAEAEETAEVPDARGAEEDAELPSGEDIVRQFEEFLRERAAGESDDEGQAPDQRPG